MKKLFFIFISIVFYYAANAQINKGRMMLGGSFSTQNSSTTSLDTSYNQDRHQTNTNSNISVSLRYGYFISNGWMVGLLGSYNNRTNENKSSMLYTGSTPNSSSSKSSIPSFSGGLFARYYRMIGKSHFAWFAEVAATAGGGKAISSYETNGIPSTNNLYANNKVFSFNANIRPGLTYFFTKVIAVEASFGNLGYYYSKNTNGIKNTVPYNVTTNSGLNSQLNFSLNSIALGINFYFGKNTE